MPMDIWDKQRILDAASARGGDPLYIWGAGLIGGQAFDEAMALGVRPAGFVDNYAAHSVREDLKDIPVLRPQALPTASYILVAARVSAEAILFELKDLGFDESHFARYSNEDYPVQPFSENDALLQEEVLKTTICRSIPNGVLTLETSDRCNLLCVMCGSQNRWKVENKHTGKEPRFDITPVRPVLDSATTLALNIAGEPLLNGALWDVLDPMKASGYGNLKSIQLHTNGQLLHQNDNIRRLAELPVPLTVSFSVDAADAETYQKIRGSRFDRLMDNIDCLFETFTAYGRKGDNLEINATLFRENITQAPRFIRMAHELGFRTVIINPLNYRYGMDYTYLRSNRNGFDFDYDQQALQYYPKLARRCVEEARQEAERLGIHLFVDSAFEVLVYNNYPDLPYPVPVDAFWEMLGNRKKKEAKKTITARISEGERVPMVRRCHRPWTDVSIQKDGGVCMCCWLAYRPIGNIRETSFDEVWNSDVAQSIRRDMRDGYLPPVCETALCEYRQESVKAYLESR